MTENHDGQMGALQAEIEGLRGIVKELKDTIDKLRDKLDATDRRHNDSCRSCTAWGRITALEIAVAEARGTARGWALGASAIMGGLSFLAAWFIRGN